MQAQLVDLYRAGIRSVYLASKVYRSVDDCLTEEAKPTFTIETLFDLPPLISEISSV